jgi:hypothetical protein
MFGFRDPKSNLSVKLPPFVMSLWIAFKFTAAQRNLNKGFHYATSRKVEASVPDDVIGFFTCPNPSSHTMAVGLTQPLTEMSTRNLPGGKGQPAHEADDFTALCEPSV